VHGGRKGYEVLKSCRSQHITHRDMCFAAFWPVSGLVTGAVAPAVRLPTLSKRSGSMNLLLTYRCGGSAGIAAFSRGAPASRFTRWRQSSSWAPEAVGGASL